MSSQPNPYLCPAPWTALYLKNDGSVSPCCHWSDFGSVGNLRGQDPSEAWNSEPARKLRRAMLQGDREIPNCSYCYRYEKAGERSLRQEFFRLHEKHLERIFGKVEPENSDWFSLVSLTISTGTRCQLRCRMCGPWASSSWKKAIDKDSGVPDELAPEVQERVRKVLRGSDALERVLFIGGEPLVSAFQYEMLDLLLEEQKEESIELFYNTNLFQLNWLEKSAIAYWNRFKKVTLYVSIDGTGELFNHIRRGHDWDRLLRNLKQVREACPHVEVFAFFTLSLCNFLEIPETMRTLVDEGIFPLNRILFTYVRDPQYMNAQNAPSEQKEAARRKTIGFMKELLTKHDARDAARLLGVLRLAVSYLFEREAEPRYYSEFLEFNRRWT